jgi:nucleotide-binding universal stress UspA family protein
MIKTAVAECEPGTPIRPASLFDRVVVGIDGSEAGFAAIRQAARLVAPDGSLEVFAAVRFAEAALAGWSAAHAADMLERDTDAVIRKGMEIAGPRASSELVDGQPLRAFLGELGRKQATLAVVGAHSHSRFAEIVLGGVAAGLLHDARCSVLIARPPLAEALFPRTLVAGSDGSPEAGAAVEVAQLLARRFAAPLTVVTALDGKDVDLERARLQTPIETTAEHPVDALVHASTTADILVVGSRGLHGPMALGSVSERVAHQARCSVLVVRARTG